MINAQITIIKSGITYNLDLYEDQPINLSLSVADIRDITKRNSTYSKTITIPATNNNNIILDNIKDVNVFTDLDQVYFNKNLEASFYYNSVLIRSGFITVQKVNIENNSYDINFLSEFANLANIIGDYYIFNNNTSTTNSGKSELDIDVSDLNHVFNITNIIGAWNSGDTLGYYYPLIDYTNNDIAESISQGMTFHNCFRTENIKPAISAKLLFDRIIEKAGFTYESTFLNAEPFIHMVIPTVGKLLSDVNNPEFDLRKCLVNKTSVQVNTYNGGNPPHAISQQGADITFNNVVVDAYSQWDPSTNSIIVNRTGKYKINTILSSLLYVGKESITTSGLVVTFDSYSYCNFIIRKISPGFSPEDIISHKVECPSSMKMVSNIIEFGDEVQLGQGDKIHMICTFNANNNIYNTSRLSLQIIPDAQNFYDGDMVDMSSIFGGQQYKQIDYITSIIKHYNLIVDEDPLRPKHLLIEPNDIYYSGGTYLDWTSKVENSTEEITFLPEFWGKNIRLTYKQDDSDWYNRWYFNLTGNIWGQKIVNSDIPNKNEIVIESIFSPTALGYYGKNKTIVSKIFNADDPLQGALNEPGISSTDQTFNIRFLYYKNIPFTTGYTETPALISIMDFYGNTIQLHSLSNYFRSIPYAGHSDIPYGNPYFDTYNYDFGTNTHYEIQYSGSSTLTASISSNNLYELYYRNFLNRVMDHDAKMVTYKIKLNEYDMFNFRFSNTIRIKNTSYIVNKIIDWNPNDFCKIELVKLSSNYIKFVKKQFSRDNIGLLPVPKIQKHINLPSPASSLGLLYLTTGSTIPYDTNSDSYYVGIGKGPNQFDADSNSIAQGQGNTLNNAINTQVQGDQNELKSNQSNITIIGSRNKII